MIFKVDGLDITPFIAYKGLKWKRADVEAPNSGRTLDGLMHRGRVATKIRLDITCRPLTSEEAGIVLNAIYPEYVNVEYDDPQFGHVLRRMYSNNNPAAFAVKKLDGTEWWNGITFPLIER